MHSKSGRLPPKAVELTCLHLVPIEFQFSFLKIILNNKKKIQKLFKHLITKYKAWDRKSSDVVLYSLVIGVFEGCVLNNDKDVR